MIELGTILDGLIQRTSEGRLKWSRSVESDRFVTSVDAISIVIRVVSSRYESYQLEILDESGETVDVLGYDNTTADQDEQLERLFVLARRSAHNIDSTLEKLAKALEL